MAADGNDKAAGTITQPFKTIRYALQKAARQEGKDIVIMLRQGTYYSESVIRIEARSFLPKSLKIKAAEKENVFISAGRKLTLKWEPFHNGVFKATIPSGVVFERLYINGKPQVLARYPNFDSTARVFNGVAADAISPERVSRWKTPIGGYVHAIHAHEWGGFHYRIIGVDSSGNVQLEGGWQNNRPMGMHKQMRFVENIFEELDAPGEWFLDRSQSTLYYYPGKNIDLRNATVEVSRFKNSIELTGTKEKPLRNVEINGVTFLHNERSFMDTREPLLRSDWTIYRGGALLLDGTENCTISNCNFEYLGGNAIMLSNYNFRDTIVSCHAGNIGASAICFIGNKNAVRSPSFRYEDYIPYDKLDKTPGPLSDNYPRQCVAVDNLLHNVGQIEKQATGVEIEIASGIIVRHNSIYNTPRAGINIGDGCFGGHLLEYNDVFNTVLETGDHGAFNSWGRDRFWSPDREYMDSLALVHPELILLDAQQTTIIRNNRFRCDHGWDIDLDDGSSNYHIYNNLCLSGGLKLREGFYRKVENNVIVNNGFHPHVWFKNSDDIFRHNIVLRKHAPILMNYWGKEIDYNLFSNEGDLKAARENSTDAHSIYGNPLFINPSSGNFSVGVNSPAFAIGFKNFPMDSFGVQTPGLKRISLSPVIPELQLPDELMAKTSTVAFLGGKIKSVDGLGDRSSYGLPDESGVIVIATGGPESLLSQSGLKNNDVIRQADNIKINAVKDLIEAQSASNWKGSIPVKVIRNQQEINIILLLKAK